MFSLSRRRCILLLFARARDRKRCNNLWSLSWEWTLSVEPAGFLYNSTLRTANRFAWGSHRVGRWSLVWSKSQVTYLTPDIVLLYSRFICAALCRCRFCLSIKQYYADFGHGSQSVGKDPPPGSVCICLWFPPHIRTMTAFYASSNPTLIPIRKRSKSVWFEKVHTYEGSLYLLLCGSGKGTKSRFLGPVCEEIDSRDDGTELTLIPTMTTMTPPKE